MINFNIPPYLGTETQYIEQAIQNKKLCGDGEFTKKCNALLKSIHLDHDVLLTTSCTSALEMAALLCDIKSGDEVIMPSYTFCSTADAFVQRGAKIVFVDIRPDTMNIDETKIESAITSKTKVIVPVHYAGVPCEMDTIMSIAKKHNLKVVEDAAQAIFSKYKGKPLGTIGDFGCLSFHETKNLSMGEGGALIINDHNNFEKAEIIREKGTNRNKFLRGEIDKYTWVNYGSSYLPSELNAAYLYGQLKDYEIIQNNRMNIWNIYYNELKETIENNGDKMPFVPKDCIHNAHIFYFKTKNLEERTKLIDFLKQNEIKATFHYIPLHSSPAGNMFGIFNGKDEYTTSESEKLIRLPLYYNLSEDDQTKVINCIKEFYKSQR